MSRAIKVVANYLPQFHEIPENDAFWGKGYTDWVAVRKAIPLFHGHIQPNKPLGNWYYSLDNYEDIRKQVEIADEYGVYGFNIYHYWFNSNLCLLSKPAQIILEHTDLDIHYMFTWDNASWKRTWSAVRHANDWAPSSDEKITASNSGDGILARLDYGTVEDWKIHFDYLLKYFKDERYIKEDNKPLFGLFNPDNEPSVLIEMIEYWNELARNNGFDGIKIVSKNNHGENKISKYSFFYEPSNSAWESRTLIDKVVKRIEKRRSNDGPKTYDYRKVWESLLKRVESLNDENIYYGCFVNFDDTPRRGKNGRVITGGTPQLFKEYMAKLIAICEKNNKSILFVTAWNEWSEGAFLEPDVANGFAYLEALNQALKN